MNIKFTGRHFEASEALQANIEAHIKELVRFNDQVTGAHIVLDHQPNETRSAHAEITIAGHGVVSVTAEAENMGKAVDEMLEKIGRVLKRENERAKEHRAPSVDKVVVDSPNKVASA